MSRIRIIFLSIFLTLSVLLGANTVLQAAYPEEDLTLRIRKIGLTQTMKKDFRERITSSYYPSTNLPKAYSRYGEFTQSFLLHSPQSGRSYMCHHYKSPAGLTQVYARLHGQRVNTLGGKFPNLKRASVYLKKKLSCCFHATSGDVANDEPHRASPRRVHFQEGASKDPAAALSHEMIPSALGLDPTYAYIFLGVNENGQRTITHIPLGAKKHPHHRPSFTTTYPVADQGQWV